MKRTLAILLAALTILALLGGCGGSDSRSASYEAEAYDYVDNGYYDYEYDDYAPAEMAEEAAYGTALSMEVPAPAQETTKDTTKIIYTADVDLETLEFDATLQALADLTEACGGYYESSSLNDRGSYRTASFSVRVPAAKYREFLSAAGELGHVRSQQESAEDVSEMYYDTAGRLETQKTKLARLQELLLEAEDMEDIITIEDAISETEERIDRLSGELRHYDALVDYSTVHLWIDEVYEVTVEPEPVVTFGDRFARGLKNGLAGFVEALQDIAVALAYSWIWLVLLGGIAALIVFLARRGRKKRLARRAAKAAQAATAPQPPQTPPSA